MMPFQAQKCWLKGGGNHEVHQTDGLYGCPASERFVEPCSGRSSDEGGGELALGAVTVSAEKREQNLQDVPASVSAFGSEDIEDAGWGDIDRVRNVIPSVVVSDEVFSTRTSRNLTGILDLEPIEPLKGIVGFSNPARDLSGAVADDLRDRYSNPLTTLGWSDVRSEKVVAPAQGVDLLVSEIIDADRTPDQIRALRPGIDEGGRRWWSAISRMNILWPKKLDGSQARRALARLFSPISGAPPNMTAQSLSPMISTRSDSLSGPVFHRHQQALETTCPQRQP